MSGETFVDDRTLFVRGLGPSTTNEDFEAHFSGVGPVRHAFVVTAQKNGTTACRGYGFVQYASAADAKHATSALHGSLLARRKIRIESAKRRQRNGGRGEASKEDTVSADSAKPKAASTGPSSPASPKDKAKAGSNGRSGVRQLSGSLGMRTVVVRTRATQGTENTPVSEAAVRRIVKSTDADSGFESCTAVANGTELRCVFRTWPLAGKAAALVHGNQYDAFVEALAGGARCRVIARNLPFSIDSQDLISAFARAGPIRSVHIPGREARSGKKATGTACVPGFSGRPSEIPEAGIKIASEGFGFLEYFLAAHAKHAVGLLNSSKIGGRVIAVDVALPRDLYKARAHPGPSDDAAEEAPEHDPTEEAGGDESTTAKNQGATPGSRNAQADASDDSDHVTLPSEASIGNPADGEEGPNRRPGSSTSEELRRTVFVRNLLFETSAQELRDAMKKYGLIEQAVLVKHPASGRPRGSAFIRFRDSAAADAAVSAASTSNASEPSSEEGMVLGGRRLQVSLAVDRKKAAELRVSDTQERDCDPRNLRLASVGRIKPNTPEAAQLSQQDLEKRAKAEREKDKKLSHNPNAFVSDVRLSVRNLPKDFDEKDLKQLFLAAARSTSDSTPKTAPRVVHVKIVRDDERNGRSKGYGFVLFESHEHALAALKRINNRADAIDLLVGSNGGNAKSDAEKSRRLRKAWDARRLIAEFAVEDRRQVQIIERVKAKGREMARNAAKERGFRDDESAEKRKPARQKRKRPNEGLVDADAQTSLDSKRRKKTVLDAPGNPERGRARPASSKGGIGGTQDGHTDASAKRSKKASARGSPSSGPRGDAKARSGKSATKKRREDKTDRFDSVVEAYKRRLARHDSTASASLF